MKLLETTIESYVEAEYQIKRLLTDTRDLMENINVFNLNADAVQKYHILYKAMEGLEEAYSSIVDLNKKVLIEGHLLKNNRGRYELCGREFTSGSLIDVWREDPDMKDGGYYISSRIEHRGGDYYCVDMPYIKLDGLKARYRAAS
ncbi:DUF5348 domain-containing protein [Saccharococcus sp. Marseille-Q5394]|uniref:DUF5348 domain-containing protein n=1 Tax=Saccharococcus sp. Marseille-Q5394 TaxID=2972778 RepID=UPI0021C9C64A|nr:DUF5348 domain-containing protein [Saccharococcus sp. Marseille-Q5394]